MTLTARRRITPVPILMVWGFASLFAGCGSLTLDSSSGGGTPACTDTDHRIRLSPAQVTRAPGQTQSFSVTTTDSIITASANGTKATWSVDGGDAFGRILTNSPSSTATYQAPVAVPSPSTATIKARLLAPNDTVCATATVTIQ